MTLLAHNIVNDTVWRQFEGDWRCWPSKRVRVSIRRTTRGFLVDARPWVIEYVNADSLPAAKAEALRLVREVILAEAELWK